jgi:hypothetical protein
LIAPAQRDARTQTPVATAPLEGATTSRMGEDIP